MADRRWPTVPKGAEAFSVSALRDWQCPYRGKRKRLDKVKEPLGPALHEGRILHDVAARYLEHCLAQRVDTDLSVIPTLVRQAFYDPDTKEPHPLPVEYATEVERTARRWAETFIVDRPHIANIEEVWLEPLDAAGANTYLYVICDVVEIHDDVAVIRDLKSDRHLRSIDDVAGDLQMWTYCWGVHQEYPHIEHFQVEMDFLRHGIVRVVEFGPEIIEQAEQVLVDSIQRVRGYRERKTFPAVAGGQCGWCGFRAECPLLRSLADPGLLNDEAEAVRAAEQLVALEARVKGLKAALSAWTSTNGPVRLRDIEYGHGLVESDKLSDARAFVERMRAIGMEDDAWAALYVGASELKRLQRNERAALVIEPLLEDASYTRFGHRKAAGGEAE